MQRLFIFLCVIAIFGCEKDEIQNTGSVKFIFHINDNMDYSDIGDVNIFTSDIPDIPLIKNPNTQNGILVVKDLIEGNYYIKYNYIYEVAFQVINGKENVVDLYYQND